MALLIATANYLLGSRLPWAMDGWSGNLLDLEFRYRACFERFRSLCLRRRKVLPLIRPGEPAADAGADQDSRTGHLHAVHVALHLAGPSAGLIRAEMRLESHDQNINCVHCFFTERAGKGGEPAAIREPDDSPLCGELVRTVKDYLIVQKA